MKSKSLLIAAATLAAGVMSASAAVYSQNIVGYVNVVVTNGGSFNLMANPLDDGAGNYLTNVFALSKAPLIKGSQCLTWNTALSQYTTTTINGNSNTGTNWQANAVQIPPGVGFFIKNGNKAGDISTVFTNTFVGTVALTSGQSVTNPIITGFNMYGSTLPISGNVTVATTPGGDPNFNYTGGFIKGSQVLTWDTANQVFSTVTLSGNSNTGTNWNSTVNISVAQGFFLFNKGNPTNMVQTAPF